MQTFAKRLYLNKINISMRLADLSIMPHCLKIELSLLKKYPSNFGNYFFQSLVWRWHISEISAIVTEKSQWGVVNKSLHSKTALKRTASELNILVNAQDFLALLNLYVLAQCLKYISRLTYYFLDYQVDLGGHYSNRY